MERNMRDQITQGIAIVNFIIGACLGIFAKEYAQANFHLILYAVLVQPQLSRSRK